MLCEMHGFAGFDFALLAALSLALTPSFYAVFSILLFRMRMFIVCHCILELHNLFFFNILIEIELYHSSYFLPPDRSTFPHQTLPMSLPFLS